jgi:RecB family exonuclease
VNRIYPSVLAPDAGAPLRLTRPDGPLPAYESHSSLSTYRECPLRYGFRYVERVPGEERPGQYAFGSGVHRAFEVYVRERIRARLNAAGPCGAQRPDAHLLWVVLDEELAASGLSPDEVEAARTRAAPLIERFLALEVSREAEPVAVELGFGVDVPLPDGSGAIRFVGYLDRVDRAPDGSTEIVDYKTGRVRDQADVDRDRQLTAYAYAAARGVLRAPITGETLPPASRLGLYFADAGTLVWTTRDAARLAAFEALLGETVGFIRGRGFPARPERWRCDWCEYGKTCAESAVRAVAAPGGAA